MRLFVAVWPPDDVVGQLRAMPRPEVTGVRWSTEDQWHVTLRFLGEVDGTNGVVAALAAASLPAATVQLGPRVERFTSSIAALPVRGVEALAVAVADAVRPLDDEFRGHLTVARSRRRPIPDEVLGGLLTARWAVREVALVRSELHPHGARYEDVARFPVPLS